MKRVFILLIMLIILSSLFFTFDNEQIQYENADLIRIHIRANSNEQKDQDIKLIIRDKLIEYLSANAINIESKDKMLEFLNSNLDKLITLSDEQLSLNGYDYKTKISLQKQEFPIRLYGDTIVDSGVYDALMIELGKAEGDNWWCIAFPQLCFGKKENKQPEKKVVIKSRFSDWFKKYKKR